MPTGQVEVQVEDWQVLNHAQASLPFYPSQCLGDLVCGGIYVSDVPADALTSPRRVCEPSTGTLTCGAAT